MLDRQRKDELDVLNDRALARRRGEAIDNDTVLDERVQPRLGLLVLVVAFGHVVCRELGLWWGRWRWRDLQTGEDDDAEREHLGAEGGDVGHPSLDGVDRGVPGEFV